MCFASLMLRSLACANSLCRMLACTPFTAVSYLLMWYLPPFVSGRVVWYLIFYCLFQALTTVSSHTSCLSSSLFFFLLLHSNLINWGLPNLYIIFQLLASFKGSADVSLSNSAGSWFLSSHFLANDLLIQPDNLQELSLVVQAKAGDLAPKDLNTQKGRILALKAIGAHLGKDSVINHLILLGN